MSQKCCSAGAKKPRKTALPSSMKQKPIHPRIRLSLFPNVPPYIRFSNTSSPSLPGRMRSVLKWKYSDVMPNIVRNIVRNTGFHIMDESSTWTGVWGNQIKSTIYRKLLDHQKYNHFPGTVEIGRKDYLCRNVQRMMSKHGGKQFQIMPQSFILPREREQFLRSYNEGEKNQLWIVKPPASYRGDGIKIVHKKSQVPRCTPIIVQKYIENPYLINSMKFDLRLYVLVTSINPLRIYLYDDGLVRFASQKYSTDLRTVANRFVHLTNYCINVQNVKFKVESDVNAPKGHKWTLRTLWRYLREDRNVDVDRVKSQLNDLIIKTLICGENGISKCIADHLPSRYNAYEVFGFDVLLDANLQPWLLEVNISPSLRSSTAVDVAVKQPLMSDILNIVGFHIPSNKNMKSHHLHTELGQPPVSRLYHDSRLYSVSLSFNEKYKQYTYANKIKREEYLEPILESLSPSDVRMLVAYEDEQARCGSFDKIFPTRDTHKYLKYFEKIRYYDQLLDAWEHKYANNRQRAIDILRPLCEKGTHLRTFRKFPKIRPSSKIKL
ncbi:tubulin monoglutamylase TTLL4-like [Planococcus citri]|uniref:tubulin monoglutamylase TTLL4-like n=1 Tax=Planococcus citri TaxID=170843 RepID=UPI0031F9161B